VKDNKQLLMTIAFRLLLVVTLAFICWQATIRNGIQLPVANSDKLLHFLAFYTLAFLLDFSFPKIRFGVLQIIVLIGYGILIEYVQSFLPNRSADIADLLTDVVGIAVYAVTIPLLLPLFFYQQDRRM